MTPLDDRAIARLSADAAWPEPEGGRYAVLEEIGRGGMGTVYRVRDEALGREAAMKVTAALAPHPELDRRLAGESAVLASLEHPGIVPVHDAGRLADGRPYYVMKLVRGVTLDRHVATVPGLFDRLRLFERLLDPVAFAHARGLVHRDLKPGNVMVGSFGEVLVMDWGVVKRPGTAEGGGAEDTRAGGPGRTGATDPDTVLGTPGFMAPEQAAGDAARVDARADVYALGAILRWLVQDLAPPRPLRAIVARAMAADPAGRYADAAALGADVGRFLAGAPVEAYAEAWWERAGRRLRPYRMAILLVLAYMVMRALVAAVFRM